MPGRIPWRTVQAERVSLLDTTRERLAGNLPGTAVVAAVEAAAVAVQVVGSQRALAARRLGRAALKVMAAAAVAGVAAAAVAVVTAERGEGPYPLWPWTGQARPSSWCLGR